MNIWLPGSGWAQVIYPYRNYHVGHQRSVLSRCVHSDPTNADSNSPGIPSKHAKPINPYEHRVANNYSGIMFEGNIIKNP